MSLKTTPAIDRPREKLIARGAESLELEELIAAIIGRGTAGYDAIKIGKLVGQVLMTTTYTTKVSDLTHIPGMGDAKACQIVAALELARRFQPPNQKRATIRSPKDALPFVSQYRYDQQENFLVLTLTGAHEVINVRHITKGTLNNCQIHPREVFAGAIEDRAASIILVHNHPSGNLDPSEQDVLMTEELTKCGELLGVAVIDHIIIGPVDGYKSIDV